MSYDIHITREKDWVDDKNPITLEEVRSIMPTLSERFRIEESGIISIQNPNGQKLSMKVGPYLEYMEENGDKSCVIFLKGNCPSFRYQSDSQLLAMCAVAEALGARLVGDDGEEYNRRQLEG